MGNVVSSICILITLLAMLYAAYHGFKAALEHANKMRILRYDHERQMAMLRNELAQVNADAAAKRQAEFPLVLGLSISITRRVSSSDAAKPPARGELGGFTVVRREEIR